MQSKKGLGLSVRGPSTVSEWRPQGLRWQQQWQQQQRKRCCPAGRIPAENPGSSQVTKKTPLSISQALRAQGQVGQLQSGKNLLPLSISTS